MGSSELKAATNNAKKNSTDKNAPPGTLANSRGMTVNVSAWFPAFK